MFMYLCVFALCTVSATFHLNGGGDWEVHIFVGPPVSLSVKQMNEGSLVLPDDTRLLPNTKYD